MRLLPGVSGLFLLSLLASGARAQSFGYGVKLGVPFTDVFSNSGIGDNSRFIIGPMVEFRLPFIGFEADALYHYVSLHPSATSLTPGSGSTWQFPLLGKLRLPATPILKPYGAAGVSFRTFNAGGSDIGVASKKGFVLGAGLDIHAIILHITPELRYTRWGTGRAVTLQANPNQFEFLVGFSR